MRERGVGEGERGRGGREGSGRWEIGGDRDRGGREGSGRERGVGEGERGR